MIQRPANGFSRPATRLASMVFQGLTHDTSVPGYNTWDPRVTGISTSFFSAGKRSRTIRSSVSRMASARVRSAS